LRIKLPVGILILSFLFPVLYLFGQNTTTKTPKKNTLEIKTETKGMKKNKKENRKKKTETVKKNSPSSSETSPADDREYEKLLRMRDHLAPNTAEGMRVSERIKKIERRMAGYAKANKPDEFMRILSEMRVPYGKTEAEYPMNYKSNELEKALLRSTALGKTNASKLPWVERGPANVSGRARGIVVDPDDPEKNTWYIGSVGGGIWKTTDAGKKWRNLSPNIPNLAISWLAMAQSNHNIIYAGTGESMYNVDVINGDGLLKSTDRGETWTQIPSTKNNDKFNNISRVIVDPKNPNIVLASTTTGRYKTTYINKSYIMKSTDGGGTWKVVYEENEISSGRVKKVLQIIETPGDFNTLYAAIEKKGILKSTDAGETWTLSSSGIDDVTGRFELAIAPTNIAKIYAAAEGTPSSNLYVSSNAGASWIKTTENGTEPNWLSSQGWYDNTIVVHPKNEDIVYVGGVYIYQITMQMPTVRKSSKLNVGTVHVDHHNLVTIPKANGSFRILVANDGGIGISTDSTTGWSKPTDGLNTTQFYGVDKKPGSSAYIGGMQDNGTWRSPENSTMASKWTYQIGGDGYETSWHFDDPNKLIGGSQYNGFLRSTDGGTTFGTGQSGLSDIGSSKAPFISKIAKTNSNPDLLFTIGASGVWKSTNFGASWALTAIPSADLGSVSSFMNVKISKANSKIVWAGSRMDAISKILVSADEGKTFTPTTVFNNPTLGGISGLATHPLKDSTAYVLFSFAQRPKILRTTNLGQSWEDISGFGTGTVSKNGFPDVAIYDLFVMPNSPNTIWVGTEIGLFESTDNGSSWHYADNGLPSVCIWFINGSEEEVFLGTHGRGIWSVNIPGLNASSMYKPFLKSASQGPDGSLAIRVNLRSLYDSTIVNVDGLPVAKIGNNLTSADTLIRIPITTIKDVNISAVAYKNGLSYESSSKKVTLIPIMAASKFYFNDFNSASNDFYGNGFTITSNSGFPNNAIHTNHPYPNNTVLTYMLKVPIIVADSNATLKYTDVALIEPGETGAPFGSPEFYDYVVVEGSRDGVEWIPLEDGYDATLDPLWLTAYNNKTNADYKLLKPHEVNLLNTFSKGEKILIRFRLYSDAMTNGWGWIIDDLEIQGQLVGVAANNRQLPSSYSLQQNYPNPFNPVTTISYTVPKASKITLKIFDALGKEVTTLVNEMKSAGSYHVTFNAARLASGTYFCRMEADGFTDTKKLILLK